MSGRPTGLIFTERERVEEDDKERPGKQKPQSRKREKPQVEKRADSPSGFLVIPIV